MVDVIARLAAQTWVHLIVAFVAMGGWAVLVNRGRPMPAPVVAGLVQGALSAPVTYALKRGLDALRGGMSRARGRWLPPFLACTLSLGALVAIHRLAGTPEWTATIALPFSVASTYAVTYNFTMLRKGPDR